MRVELGWNLGSYTSCIPFSNTGFSPRKTDVYLSYLSTFHLQPASRFRSSMFNTWKCWKAQMVWWCPCTFSSCTTKKWTILGWVKGQTTDLGGQIPCREFNVGYSMYGYELARTWKPSLKELLYQLERFGSEVPISLRGHIEDTTTWNSKQPVFLWLFQLDDSNSLHKKWLFHQRSVKKWLFRVPGTHWYKELVQIPPLAAQEMFDDPKKKLVPNKMFHVFSVASNNREPLQVSGYCKSYTAAPKSCSFFQPNCNSTLPHGKTQNTGTCCFPICNSRFSCANLMQSARDSFGVSNEGMDNPSLGWEIWFQIRSGECQKIPKDIWSCDHLRKKQWYKKVCRFYFHGMRNCEKPWRTQWWYDWWMKSPVKWVVCPMMYQFYYIPHVASQ